MAAFFAKDRHDHRIRTCLAEAVDRLAQIVQLIFIALVV